VKLGDEDSTDAVGGISHTMQSANDRSSSSHSLSIQQCVFTSNQGRMVLHSIPRSNPGLLRLQAAQVSLFVAVHCTKELHESTHIKFIAGTSLGVVSGLAIETLVVDTLSEDHVGAISHSIQVAKDRSSSSHSLSMQQSVFDSNHGLRMSHPVLLIKPGLLLSQALQVSRFVAVH
jgi:hypothetical protein